MLQQLAKVLLSVLVARLLDKVKYMHGFHHRGRAIIMVATSPLSNKANRRWLLHRVDEPFRSQERGSRLCLWLPRDKAWIERTRRALLRERLALRFPIRIPIFRFETSED